MLFFNRQSIIEGSNIDLATTLVCELGTVCALFKATINRFHSIHNVSQLIFVSMFMNHAVIVYEFLFTHALLQNFTLTTRIGCETFGIEKKRLIIALKRAQTFPSLQAKLVARSMFEPSIIDCRLKNIIWTVIFASLITEHFEHWMNPFGEIAVCL